MIPWIAWNLIEFQKKSNTKLKIGAKLGLNHLMTQIQNKAPHGEKKNTVQFHKKCIYDAPERLHSVKDDIQHNEAKNHNSEEGLRGE